MSAPQITVVKGASPAAAAGLEVGDELLALNGEAPKDVIEYSRLADEPDVEVVIRRRGQVLPARVVAKDAGVPLGVEISSPVFDRVRTCDNHCAFCFIHQLPKGMRRSLYLKDDDYRLSFLYGNFTTLTRFTELDLERVIDERLSPLFVSIHATDPAVRAHMLRNPRGATSLRWLRALLEAGVEVHGQIVVCPGVNDGTVLEDTMAGILDEYPRLATVGVVPLGVSRHSSEAEMRPHRTEEAEAVCQLVGEWQELFSAALGRRLAYVADEYLLMAGRPFPGAGHYDGFPQHENGIGMARAFVEAFWGDTDRAYGVRPGFFAAVDGAPASGYRAAKAAGRSGREPAAARPTSVITGAYGARVLGPLLAEAAAAGAVAVTPRLLVVENDYFGGNIGVAGLLTGTDLARALASEPEGRRYLLPDACLSEGRFLDGLTLDDLPRPVEVVASDGWSLRQALAGGARRLATLSVRPG